MISIDSWVLLSVKWKLDVERGPEARGQPEARTPAFSQIEIGSPL